jgi:hypothetical protein
MTTAQRTLTINAAFLQEIKDDNRELKHLLDECAERLTYSAAARVDAKRLVGSLARLRDQLALHFTLEEAYGYFDDAIDVAPRLSRQAETLRSQHSGLYLSLCDVVERAEQLLYHEAHATAAGNIARAFADFHQQFRDHEAAEDALIMQTVNEEIGGGD